jgi:hypothetical protein
LGASFGELMVVGWVCYLQRPRDECIALKGEEACAHLIEAHKVCLRAEGFKVRQLTLSGDSPPPTTGRVAGAAC